MILAALDVAYSDLSAHAACILFDRWDACCPYDVYSRWMPRPQPYVSGRFSERELPPLMNVLRILPSLPDVILIDGYVELKKNETLGLGGILFRTLKERSAIIGVAKSRYRGANHAIPVLRGQSRRPLWVTAIGVEAREAAAHVQWMHGQSRIPTLLQIADSHARSGIEVLPPATEPSQG